MGTLPPGGGHKEIIWSRLSEEDRTKFREAAGEQWDKWMANGALKILSLDESRAVLQDDLERRGELARVLTPRFALTDKNSAHRTPTNQLPLKASARIVVPGFRDLENLRGQLRRDAPTGSRQAQHVLFSLAACRPSWFLRGADVRAAFLKGDPYVQRILYMTGTDGSKGPSIPIPKGAVAKVLKGIFGLADAPREWWLRLDREMNLKNHGWTRSTLDGALWYFWRKNDKKQKDAQKDQNANGSTYIPENDKELCGVVVGHVDDLLFAGDGEALESLEALGKVLGFGSVEAEAFTWCGKRIERDPNTGDIVILMKTYHQRLMPVVVPRSRRQELSALLTPQEVKKLKGILGSLQWLVAQVRFDLAFRVSSLQGENPPTVGALLRANKTLTEAKKDADFELRFRSLPLMESGIMMVSDAAGQVVQASSTSWTSAHTAFRGSAGLRTLQRPWEPRRGWIAQS